jgi:hypothetical protein
LQHTRHIPKLTIDLEAITSHLDALAGMDPCPSCDAALTVLAGDVAQLLTEIGQLYGALLSARLESANLRAAIRAAVGAAADGEPDPLAYLRDELADNDAGPAGGWCG